MSIQLRSRRIYSLSPGRVSLGPASRVLSNGTQPNPPGGGCSLFLAMVSGEAPWQELRLRCPGHPAELSQEPELTQPSVS